MLRDRDWVVDQVTSGVSSHDFTGTDPAGRTWAIEVKNCAGIIPAHKRQAMAQGKARRLPWMLMNKIAGTSSWLVQRQGELPAIWHGKVYGLSADEETAASQGRNPSAAESHNEVEV